MVELSTGYALREGADPAAAHAFLVDSYWNRGISRDQVALALDHSVSVSVWQAGAQVGMARVVSDRVTIAYLNDVYVLEAHRGRGLAAALIANLRARPEFSEVGRWLLFTKDAQGFYAGYGWREYPWPERTMIIDPKVFPE